MGFLVSVLIIGIFTQNALALECYDCGAGTPCKTPLDKTSKCNNGEVCITMVTYKRSNLSVPFTKSAGLVRRGCYPDGSICNLKNSIWGSCFPTIISPNLEPSELSCSRCCSSDKCNTDFPDWKTDNLNSTPGQSASVLLVTMATLLMLLLHKM